MELSIGEMLMIVLAIVVLFGPNKIPEIARGLGEGVRKMRGAMEDVKTEILKDGDNPVSEIKREIDKVKQSVKDYNPAEKIREELELKKHLENKKSASVTENDTDKFSDDYQGPVSR